MTLVWFEMSIVTMYCKTFTLTLQFQGLNESDESFITEVFSGCVQYTSIMKVC